MWSEISIRLPGPTSAPQRPGGVGEHEDLRARRAQRADWGADVLEVAALVHVRAPLEHRHRHVADVAQHGRPPWPATLGSGKPGSVGVVDRGGIRHGVGHRAEARAEHHAHARPKAGALVHDGRRLAVTHPRRLELERERQQLADGRGLRGPPGRRGGPGCRRRELRQPLTAAAAGRADVHVLGGHRHLGDPRLARRDQRADGGGLGALALRIARVLDVRAHVDARRPAPRSAAPTGKCE